MRAKVFQSWSNLQDREKMTILIGSIVVIGAACYLLFTTLWTTHSSLTREKVALMVESGWIQEQSALAEQLINNCRTNQFPSLDNQDLFELIASRNQMVLDSVIENISNNEASYAIRIESNDGNSILRFIHQSTCQGFTLSHVEIDKSESESFYTGELEFSHEG